MSWRNAASLAPLLCPTGRDANIASHLGDRVPAPEKLSEGSHVGSYIAGDGLSRQVVAIVPVTVLEAHRTMSPMGRARTPVQFNKAFAARLKAARIAAGYDTQKPFATALGIEVERYKKWESGRTPIQHEYVEAVCGLTGKDANYFYGIIPAREQIVKRTGT